tara:strand:- start:41 stop:442 length:402 start_codon:yes stop_codon:yes gene_type:complete
MNVSVIVATFEGCNPEQINDPHFFEQLLEESSKAGNFTVLHTYIHPFEPQGVTGTAVLAESHIALHSWPENRTLFVDLATCSGDEATQRAFNRMCELIEHQQVIPHSIQCTARNQPYSVLLPEENESNKHPPC